MSFWNNLFSGSDEATPANAPIKEGTNHWTSKVAGISLQTRIFQNSVGVSSIEITNKKSQETIEFPRRSLDAVFKAILEIQHTLKKSGNQEEEGASDSIQKDVLFNGNTVVAIEVHPGVERRTVIRSDRTSTTGNKILNIPVEALGSLVGHFEKIYKKDHLILNSIVDYHHLFQFTFEGESESIKSDLALRKNALWEIVPYLSLIHI